MACTAMLMIPRWPLPSYAISLVLKQHIISAAHSWPRDHTSHTSLLVQLRQLSDLSTVTDQLGGGER